MPNPINHHDEPDFIINAHAHIFTIDHVPDKFGRKLLPGFLGNVFTMKKIKWYYQNHTRWGTKEARKKIFDRKQRYYRFIGILKKTLIFYWIYILLLWLFKWLIAFIYNILALKVFLGTISKEAIQRFMTLGRYSNYDSQQKIFNFLKNSFPPKTKFVALSMDMEYMEAGKPAISFEDQINNLIDLKKSPSKKDILYPFVAVDPRRLKSYREDDTKPDFLEKLKSLIEEDNFSGFKLYPALGYWPFDKELIPVYEYAISKDLPVMTHCIPGTVFYRGKKERAWNHHPILKYKYKGGDEAVPLPLLNKKNSIYTTYFTHPLNYDCLMDKDLLKTYLGREVDLSRLKICMGHFGGSEAWDKYLEDNWNPYNNNINNPGNEGKTLTDKRHQVWWNASWLSIIYDLMLKYPNFYADVSYILHNEYLYPILKELLSNETAKKRILFGTDFYVVSQKESEKSLFHNLRGYLGTELFNQIAYENPKKYLGI